MRLLRAIRSRQAGLSLIELLIAMMLTGLILTMGVWMFVAGTHSVSLAQSIDGGTRQASNGMNQVARMVRAATPNPLASPTPGQPLNAPAIIAATATSVQFFAYVNLSGAESPVRVTYSVVNGILQESQAPALSNTAGANGHWDFGAAGSPRNLCNSIPAGVSVFRYFNKAGSELLPANLLQDAQRAAISSIQVTITIQPTGAANAVTVTNTIGMANVG
ncbi:type II secretion system protein J [Leifsonia sp. LS-T14]|uniref:PulJ/GspJ family protein n=1 Tax=unclassified Leifsonia TaxID=2663824 RepID=UPI0035A6C813